MLTKQDSSAHHGSHANGAAETAMAVIGASAPMQLKVQAIVQKIQRVLRTTITPPLSPKL